jgi:RNA polymerase sigma-70 factor, ECF subfamily
MVTIQNIDDAHACELLRRVSGGCQASFEALYRMLSKRVYAFVCRSIDNPDVAKEIMIDTMYEVWNSAGRFRGDAKVSTWTLGIARNKLLMTLRSRRETRHEDIDEYADLVEDGGPGVFDQVAGKEMNGLLNDCLGKLSPAHRECLHLLHFEECTVAEIAHLLDIPEGTVKSRLSHARANLLRCMQARLGGPLEFAGHDHAH